VLAGATGTKRKYHCNYAGCSKSFTTSGHLARHNRIHTGEKNFQSMFPGCPSRFSRQDNMMQHYRTHMSTKSRRTQKKPTLFVDPMQGHAANAGARANSFRLQAMHMDSLPTPPLSATQAGFPSPYSSPFERPAADYFPRMADSPPPQHFVARSIAGPDGMLPSIHQLMDQRSPNRHVALASPLPSPTFPNNANAFQATRFSPYPQAQAQVQENIRRPMNSELAAQVSAAQRKSEDTSELERLAHVVSTFG
jgi:hypothetical protein